METAAHSSTLAWGVPQTEELGRLQSIGLQRVRDNWSDLARMHPRHWDFWRLHKWSYCATIREPWPPGFKTNNFWQLTPEAWESSAEWVCPSVPGGWPWQWEPSLEQKGTSGEEYSFFCSLDENHVPTSWGKKKQNKHYCFSDYSDLLYIQPTLNTHIKNHIILQWHSRIIQSIFLLSALKI